MAISATTRLGLPQWSEGSDPPISRAQANAAFLALEENVVIFTAGEASERPDPAAAVAHMLYWATDTDTLSYCDGDEWLTIVDVGDLSSYLTTATAASTYLTQANAASTYLTIANGLAKAGGTMTGDLDMDENDLVDPTVTGARDKLFTDTTNSGTVGIDPANGQLQVLTLTGNVTFTFSGNFEAGMGVRVQLIQDGTGGRTVTWPAGALFVGGVEPDIGATAGAVSVVFIYYNGTSFFVHDGGTWETA